MNDKQHEADFERRICKELDAGLGALDSHIAESLLQSRQKALKQTETRWVDRIRFSTAVSVRGFASLAMVVMAVSLWYTTRPQLTAHKAEELEVLTIASALDMYKEMEMLQLLARIDEDK